MGAGEDTSADAVGGPGGRGAADADARGAADAACVNADAAGGAAGLGSASGGGAAAGGSDAPTVGAGAPLSAAWREGRVRAAACGRRQWRGSPCAWRCETAAASRCRTRSPTSWTDACRTPDERRRPDGRRKSLSGAAKHRSPCCRHCRLHLPGLGL